MSADARRPPPSPVEPLSLLEATRATPAWSEPSASPAEDIREFIQWCLSDRAPAAGYTQPEPWQEQLARQVLESDCMDWYSGGTRLVTMSCARGYGKTATAERLSSSEKASEELLTRSKSGATTFVTPEHLSALELQRQALLQEPEFSGRWVPDEPCTDPRWDDASPRVPRPLLELSLASDLFRSPMP